MQVIVLQENFQKEANSEEHFTKNKLNTFQSIGNFVQYSILTATYVFIKYLYIHRPKKIFSQNVYRNIASCERLDGYGGKSGNPS